MSVDNPRPLRVGEVMTSSVVTVRPSTPFKDIVRLLYENRISAVPVSDAYDRLLGVVSEADLLRRQEEGAAVGYGTTAGDIMHAPAVTIDPWASLAWAVRLMRHNDVKRLCVVDPTTERLVGIVSRADVLKVYLRSDATIRGEVEAVLRPWSRHHAADIEVEVVDGVVRLTGTVGHDGASDSLAGLVAAVDGVVRADIQILDSPSGASTDTVPAV